ncbi:hypothetical protein [Dictyoglomus thermophilum]|uniref:Uncharacterized protein n=1 Tax=Dictyoglomus thermophilum (strain ATCC 35947 / DSM 3960 / H-6-12) TaxID=309799 RepID=B5YB92_DICT6|nr:hypothetical protein [Dictyoglomus thermophilum]ACI19490.1 hypothetical protein DICTH_1809 [Dictyoglomus thermophilum H-6-12]
MLKNYFLGKIKNLLVCFSLLFLLLGAIVLGSMEESKTIILNGRIYNLIPLSKVLSIRVVASSGMFTEVTTSCSYGTVGANIAWAKGQANFRAYIGIAGVGGTIGSFSLSVSDSVIL